MFARASFRCSAPLRQSIRRTYASDSQPRSSSATPWIVAAAAVATGVGGYWYFGGNAADRVTAPLKEERKDGLTSGGTAKSTPAPKDAPKTFTGGDQDFVDLKLARVEPYNHNTKKFVFDLPEKDHVSGLNVASAIITKFKPEDAEKPVIRPYTPISDEGEPGHMDLMVKAYPNGPMSQHLHSMKPGDTLSIKGPIPKYAWSANKHSHITLIAGGTGITPMYQLTRAIFSNPDDQTKVSLIFGNITEKDILLKEEFDKLEKDFPQRFRAFYTLDNPPDDWKLGKGFITKDLLKEVIPDPKSENIKVFVCGPPGLYKAISGAKTSPKDQGELTGILKELGYSQDQVFKF